MNDDRLDTIIAKLDKLAESLEDRVNALEQFAAAVKALGVVGLAIFSTLIYYMVGLIRH